MLSWFDRNGQTARTLGERGQSTNVTFSPDGTCLAASLTGGQPAKADVWIMDATSGSSSRLTGDAAVDVTPIWSAGTQVAFGSQRAALFFPAADEAVMSAAMRLTGDAEPGEPRTIVPAAVTLVIRHAYAVAKDGQRVLIPVLDQQNPSVITAVEFVRAAGAVR